MAKNTDDFNYATAQKRLEKILEEMENGKTGIDQLEERILEAKTLLDLSQKKLAYIEKILVKWD